VHRSFPGKANVPKYPQLLTCLGCASMLLLPVAGRSGALPAAAAQLPPATSPALQWAGVRDRFLEDYFRAQPELAVGAGRHEFDGQVEDLSAAGLAAEVTRLHAARDRMVAVDPATLPSAERFERDYALRVIDADLFWREKARAPFRNPYWYIQLIDPQPYVGRNYAAPDVRLKAFVAYAHRVPAIAANIRANLAGPLPRSFVELAIKGFGGYADFFREDVPAAFAEVRDPGLQRQLADVDATAATAMTGLREFFVGKRRTANEDFALGRELFAQMLRDTERVDIPVVQIEAVGRADLERNTAALRQACDRYLPGGSLRACIAKTNAEKPQEGVVAAGTADLKRLREFVVQHQIVTVPNADEALVAESPPYNRGNGAYIQLPGPYDHGVHAVFYISPPDPNWTAVEQLAYVPSRAQLLVGAVHEVWPGHFLQYLHSNSSPSKLEGTWVSYGFAEGWAHYAEELMIEEGLADDDPALHIAQLAGAMLRDVRLLSAIGLHTGGMTQEESEQMFMNAALQDAGTARQQAARGTYDPEYLKYTLGKLMIRKLRGDWVAAQLGGRTATPAEQRLLWHDFHDRLLSFGGPAIPRLRAVMLGDASPPL